MGGGISGRKCPQGLGESRDDRGVGTGEHECSLEGVVALASARLVMTLREGSR